MARQWKTNRSAAWPAWVKDPILILKYSVKMTAMNSISQPMHSPMPPAVIAMLAYSSRLMLTETSSASVDLESSDPASGDLTDPATAITSVKGYSHYGIND